MLSGQFTPSSANFVPRQQLLIEDDTTSTQLSTTGKDEKIYSTSVQTNLTTIQSSSTTSGTTGPVTTTTTTTIPIPGILNISSLPGSEKVPDGQQPSLHAQTNLSVAAIASNSSANDANGRSAALERAYVHDVYENCEEPSGPIRPRVAQFLAGLEPGSIVCDVGCGNGRYLTSCNPLICTIGVDRCYRLTKIAREREGEVALCDNLELPFRDESFDAVLSLAVVHHFATTERRVGAIRELARILRIGGRVIITVWALEQRHRRFESQDVLIPWQPPKNRNYNYSDDEDDDDYLPPYHAYTEDSTNSSRSAGDGDSSSLSSSSPGESCYSFVRRAIQKLAGGRKHSWFLDSWNSKDTKNDSSLDYEDAKDLPIELRRLEDFEDFPEPPLSAGLKSRSLGSILNPPPRQIVRSRSSVPSLGAQMPEQMSTTTTTTTSTSSQQQSTVALATFQSPQKVSVTTSTSCTSTCSGAGNSAISQSTSAIQQDKKSTTTSTTTTANSSPTAQGATGRRPKLVKQKQSLCDDEYQLPDNPFHNNCSSTNSSSCCNTNNITNNNINSAEKNKLFLRKQSSLNEELMAESRLREKERVRKRIQKQMSLNEAFLCRSLFSKRLQVIREGFTTKLKTSTGSLERATKNGFVKIMQNFKSSQFASSTAATTTTTTTTHNQQNSSTTAMSNTQKDHSHDSTQNNSNTVNNQSKTSTVCTGGSSSTNSCNNNNCNNSCSNVSNGNEDQKPRRHSRESGSDSSKDSSLQSDTSIESEDSFASVIYIPRPEQQGSGNVNNNNNNNNNSGNNLCNNSNSISGSINCKINNSHKIPSVPTSPLILPCPPTPAHSPAAATTTTTTTMTPTGMSILSPPKSITNSNSLQGNSKSLTNRFTFDEEHILQHHQQNKKCSPADNLGCNNSNNISKIAEQRSQLHQKISKLTRQAIKELPSIPKFRKQQSLQPQIFKASFPLVRRASAAPAVPKLMSLELFNPETDDLDSDSSEPSSPDSIDSVISALKPGVDEDLSKSSKQQQQQSFSEVPKVPLRYSIDVPSSNKFPTQKDIHQQYSLDSQSIEKDQQRSICQENNIPVDISKRDTQSNSTLVDNISVVESITSDITTDKYLALSQDVSNNSNSFCNSTNPNRQEFVDFAEKLSAQLLKELEENDKLDNNLPHTGIDGEDENFTSELINAVDNPFVNKQNGDMRDLCTLREELRERRLMLANLTSQYNQQKSPTPTSSSTSSLSSQTRSFTIHEEEDEENEAYISSYESKTFKAKYLKNLSNSSGYQQYNFMPDTAFLIEDDGDGSGRDDDVDEMENGVILEEDEDQLEDEAEYGAGDCDKKSSNPTGLDESSSPPPQEQLETRQSTESWGHSTSETSLDSPSQGGGATTHHRYYHVFREGELDALINHHVTSLHIVSSYYERASWCVVAEKVQVWTI